jgi:hypothetical protein
MSKVGGLTARRFTNLHVLKFRPACHNVLIFRTLGLNYAFDCKCSESELPAGDCQTVLSEDVFELDERSEGKEGLDRAEPEIDLEEDPFQLAPMGGPTRDWEDSIRCNDP